MNVLIADTQVERAATGWLFSTKLKIGFSYFNRFAVNALSLLVSDLIGLLLALELTALARWAIFGSPMSPQWMGAIMGAWTIGAFSWKILPGWGLSPVEILRRLVILSSILFGSVSAVLFLTQLGFEHSRFTIICGFLFTLPIVPFMRMITKRVLIRHKLWGVPVAIYGGGLAGRNIIQRLQEEPGQGYYPVCVFDDNPELLDHIIEGIPVRGTTDSIAHNVPVAILAMTRIDGGRISELMEGTLSNYLRVLIIPNLIHTPSLWATTCDLSGTPALQMSNNLLDPSKRILKRGFELGITYATLPIWGPLFLALYALIWLEDRQNPIFWQRRLGQGETPFDTWKFRTMVPNAEAVLEEKLREDPELRAEWEKNCKLRKDPRITKVGRFLRITSLDEIPQLINVLRGEMSLIGPRPLPAYHYYKLPNSIRNVRKRVKPGMTGLWQVSGRSNAGNEGMIRWDPYYVRNWSLWLDIVILVRTARVVLLGSGAR